MRVILWPARAPIRAVYWIVELTDWPDVGPDVGPVLEDVEL